MGYDMHFRMRDEAEAAAVAAIQDQFQAAARERDMLPEGEAGVFNAERAKREGLDWEDDRCYDGRTDRWKAAQAKVHQLYVAMLDTEESYFRANIFSMGRLRQIMGTVGMVFEAPQDQMPEWPKAEEFGTSYDDVDALQCPDDYPDKQWDDAALRAAVAFQEEIDRVLSWHGPEIPGIPVHKFGSNDGWHVLPAECEAAVRIYEQFVAGHGEDAARNLVENTGYPWERWQQWIAYLRAAVRHGGFEVH